MSAASARPFRITRNERLVARARWWLLQYIGYYCDGTELWCWWMRPARWAWIALGWLPGSRLYAD